MLASLSLGGWLRVNSGKLMLPAVAKVRIQWPGTLFGGGIRLRLPGFGFTKLSLATQTDPLEGMQVDQVARAIAGVIREYKRVDVQAIGAGLSISQSKQRLSQSITSKMMASP